MVVVDPTAGSGDGDGWQPYGIRKRSWWWAMNPAAREPSELGGEVEANDCAMGSGSGSSGQ